MNEVMEEKTFYVRIEYEVIDDPELMEGFKPASGISLDVAGCTKPDMAAESGKYKLTSPKWISQVSATLLYSTGHMHDGGELPFVHFSLSGFFWGFDAFGLTRLREVLIQCHHRCQYDNL